jgi:GT2 family glycosyltransferase
MSLPRVSVIVLNWNGRYLLPPTLQALLRTDYPNFEAVVVDNGSTDGSPELVRREFPQVRVIETGCNLGFAGGNNVGIGATLGEYVVLLNSDTQVTPGWLTPLVDAAEADPRVAACCPKLLYLYDRLDLQLTSETFVPARAGAGTDGRTLGVQLYAATVDSPYGPQLADPLDGFFPPEGPPGRRFRWTEAQAGLRIPVPSPSGTVVRLRLAAPRPDGRPVRVTLYAGDETVAELSVGPRVQEYTLQLPEAVAAQARPHIQHAGHLLLPELAARDRGTIVRNGIALSEPDVGQYDRCEEVFSACGAALLLRRAALLQVGLLDERMFMYYEDVDLCWRLRMHGWKVLYVPQSVVRHLHCGSSGEWSPLFVYNVERSRLLMLLKNAPASLAAREWGTYLLSTALGWGRAVRALVQRAPHACEVLARAWLQTRVNASVLAALPGLLAERQIQQRTRCLPDRDILRWVTSPSSSVEQVGHAPSPIAPAGTRVEALFPSPMQQERGPGGEGPR